MLIDKRKLPLDMTDNDGWTALHISAQKGSYELVRYFADMGTDIHLTTNDGLNCLHIAALHGHLNLCKILINKHKFDVNVAGKGGRTALHYSAQSGKYELVTYFADMGTDIQLKTDDGRNCLHIAAREGHFNLCKMLIDKHEFDVHMTSNDGWTALHWSVKSGNYELVTYFTDMGTDIHLKTNKGFNCLHIAAYKGHLNLCKMLIDNHKFDVDMTDNDGWSALHWSAQGDNYEIVTYFADIGTDIHLKTNDGRNCLHIAARKGHLNLCKVLIYEYKFDVNMAKIHGRTALHFSAEGGHYDLVTYFADMGTDIHLTTNDGLNCLHMAALNGHLNLCKILINEHKFNVNVAGKLGWTALHISAQNGSYELFTYFADMGTDIYLTTNDGLNCLHIAALNGHLNFCKILINKYNFDVNVAEKHGRTALHYSTQSGNYELVTYFADMGTDIQLKANNGKNCLHIAALMGDLNLCKMLINKHKFNVDMTDNDGWTALHCSVQSGNYELLTYFADMGTDIQLKTNFGINCLHIAAHEGYINLCKVLIDNHKFDVDMTDNDGCTALHRSAQIGNYELVTYFADMGTDIQLKTNDGRNCLHIAACEGHFDLCKMLIDQYNFDVHMTDNAGWTALHWSVESGNYELVTYFANIATDIHLKTNDGRNCLHIAAHEGHFIVCKMLIDNHKFDVHTTDNDGRNALHFSAQSGKYDLVTYLANMGMDIQLKTDDGRNCLHVAAFMGHLNLCKTLIDKHKFDVNMTDNDGWTALHFSAQSGKYDLVTYFADIGTDIQLKTNDGRNCLHIAASEGHFNLCKMLIDKHELDVNRTDNIGCTALHSSVESGDYELVTSFADMGTDIYLKTNDGLNCLHIAALKGHLNLCKTLIDKHKFDVAMTDNNGRTALHFSAQSGKYDLVTYFADMGTDIQLKTNDGRNCLHVAAFMGHLNLCKTLIEKHKFDVDMTDNDGWTALHSSAQSGKYDLVTYFAGMGTDIQLKTNDGRNCLHIAALKGHLSLCKMLIDKHKFDVNVAHKLGWTAAHFSVQIGNCDLLTYFADMGTDIHLKANDGRNCLHIAAVMGHLNLCKILIDEYKFDVNMINYNGWTALHFSVQSGNYELVNELVTYFANKGTDIHLKTDDGKNCLHIAALKGDLNLCKVLMHEYNFDLHLPSKDGWTAIHCSAQSGNYELVTYFANMGTDIQLKTNDGRNCLHIAALMGHLNLCKMLLDKHKFDINVADKLGWTAIHFSAQSDNCELVDFFADMGTDIHLKTNDGRNCLHIAALMGHLNLCKMLLDKHKFDINVADKLGWTAIHFSAQSDNCELVDFFADMGTDIHLKTNDGRNCLHIAAVMGHLNLCRVLINKHKFDVHMFDNAGWTALHFSALSGNYELVTYFADMGTDIQLKTNDGRSCLHITALLGHLNLCKVLINNHKFDVHMTDNDGWKAVHFSAQSGNYELFTYFADMGIDIHLKTNDGRNCLHIAAFKGSLSLCKVLMYEYKFDLNLSDNDGWKALHWAVQSGNYELVTYFADEGTDIKVKTNNGTNCLHIAADAGYFNLCKVLIDEHKFDVNMADNDGWTALHWSAHSDNYELVTYFADMGTDIHLKINDGRNCLHIAALKGYYNLCKMLIDKYKFDADMTDNHGWKALHWSVESGNYELVTYFIDIETDIHVETNDGLNCLHIAAFKGHLNLCKMLIEKHKFDVDMIDYEGRTALHWSALGNNYELVTYFVYKGTDIHLKTIDGRNCLHIAAVMGHLNLCKILIDEYKFDVTMTNYNGWTALHFSAQSGNYELVNELVTYFANKGTDIHLKTDDGKNCLHIAAFKGDLNLCKVLIHEYNFDLHLPSKDGWTALHCSVQSGNYELVTYFAGMGTNIHLKTMDYGINCLHIAAYHGHLKLCKYFLEIHNFDVNMKDNGGLTPLHLSAENGSFDVFSYILRKGSEIYCKTNNMKNVLHFSAKNGHVEICEFVLKQFTKDYNENVMRNQHALIGQSYMSQVFYKYNTIFLHAMDNDGNTYLHLAASANQAKVCELLLKYDTEIITLLNKEDESAREIAQEKGHKDVLKVLEKEYNRTGMLFKIFYYTDEKILLFSSQFPLNWKKRF